MTPKERAWNDYAAEAAADPYMTTVQRVEYADAMLATTAGQMRVLSYATNDAGRQLREAAGAAVRRFATAIEAARARP